MDDSHRFSDSEVTTGSPNHFSQQFSQAEAELGFPVAQAAAFSRLSEQLGCLLHAPELNFCSDARIGGVPVHRCVLSARSPFFREKFAAGATELEIVDLAEGFEVGPEALVAVLQYIYSGRLEELPIGVAECVDESCIRHEACWPALHFMLQVLHAASRFQIHELVSLFQRRLFDILNEVAKDDILPILVVANLNKNHCGQLLEKCIELVAVSDIESVTLEKKLSQELVKRILDVRAHLGSDGSNGLGLPAAKKIYGALDTDDIELVKRFIDGKPTILDDAKALHYAVAFCHTNVTKQLLDLHLADINGRDHRNRTVLHIAAMRKEPEIIMYLLDKGARPLDVTTDGRTALQIAKRLTRAVDYRSVGTAPTPRERLSIEVLEQAESRDSVTEVTSIPVEMTSDNPREKLFYLKSRVWLAECLFPAEAKTAMNNANVEGALKFHRSNSCAGSKRSACDVIKAPFKMTEEDFRLMNALATTVTLGMRFFPRCSKLINKILDEGLSDRLTAELDTSEERKNRFNEIMEDFSLAFTEDKKELEYASPSASTSKSTRRGSKAAKRCQ
ncbi:BTB/POZ domain and ankyrin repeat-containing protein NPR1-like [Zingiber officinale]|uniref:BTB/POZ domain and ankyrin repeat-containing protein NPR1-like n=1 Tax=Zingiber officinale TaxID=94328 RepID=UPI001C4BCFD0|nr:BTB/POZ domain and ankyrin repeat-containing protein NPR1-like [Zingiber officinale]